MQSVLVVREGGLAGLAAGLAARPDILLLEGVAGLEPPNRCGPEPRIFVRIGPLDSDGVGAELEAALGAGIRGIWLPGAIGRRSVEQLGAKLAVREAEHGTEIGSTRIIASVESAQGALAVGSLSVAGPRLAGLAWDERAIRRELGLPADVSPREPDPAPCLQIRAMLVLAARAAGILAIDGPCNPADASDGLASAVARARRDGFSGMLALTPAQVAGIRTA